MLGLVRWGPYLLAALIGAALAGGLTVTLGAKRLALEQAAHARDNQQHAQQMKAVSDAALAAEQQALAQRDAAAQRIETLNTRLTEEAEHHEDDNRRLRAALASGTERVRVAVTDCATGGRRVPGAAGAAGVGDGGAAVAELDRAVAQRVFGVAGDDQHEIDKLSALQGYVCAIRPQTPACAK
ncbi:lysozyme [Burkholderia stagnalis]|nr:lysis system i-spanin subunit Rz [Burkholderia stagnalis]RQQ56913.1 lysozyme [Burkholderia stagnalis]